jgi:PadR family transcriptional regulator PadR
MDANMKRGFLDVLVLSLLKSEDSYGYKIVSELSRIAEVSESTLYPILKRLLEAKYISSYTVEHSGRLRKYYRFENDGQKKIDEFLNDFEEILTIYNFIEGATR